jgi:hypothetical protein
MKGVTAGAGTRESIEISEGFIPERRLWTAVLVMAVEDWRDGSLRAKRAAQQFLFEDDHDFEEVCAGAGLDPSTLRSKLLKVGRRVTMHGPLQGAIAA